MPSEYLPVGVIIERRKLSNPWLDAIWLPVAILPGVPATAPWTVLEESEEVRRVYAGPFTMGLHSVDTANYRNNLETGSPQIWVALRESEGEHPVKVVGVTADPAEGEAYTEAGQDTVEAVPMPREIAERLAAFIAEHHVERTFFKRKRDRLDPEALGRRGGPPLLKKDGQDD